MILREAVLRSLTAVGGAREAEFYAKVFQNEAPEKFALIVLDPRCLKNPLLEALISDLRILSDLSLTPVLLLGALDEDRTSVRFQSQRLLKSLESAGIHCAKLNCASYALIPDVQAKAANGRVVILEMTEIEGRMDLAHLVSALDPAKVIFLQPSGGLRRAGERLPVINLAELDSGLKADDLSPGQKRFLTMASALARNLENRASYVIASPLNLLQELFTTRGSGTMLRRAAKIVTGNSYRPFDKSRLKASVEDAFEKPLAQDYFDRPIIWAIIEENYRGGALVTRLSGLPYLSKFWITRAAQGEGISRDIWDALCAQVPAFFWRSRLQNPFNAWYMQACDGMQIAGDWRIFWHGLTAPEIPGAIIAAANAPHDFEYEPAQN